MVFEQIQQTKTKHLGTITAQLKNHYKTNGFQTFSKHMVASTCHLCQNPLQNQWFLNQPNAPKTKHLEAITAHLKNHYKTNGFLTLSKHMVASTGHLCQKPLQNQWFLNQPNTPSTKHLEAIITQLKNHYKTNGF